MGEVRSIPEGEVPYADVARWAEPYLDTAPRGPYLKNSARNAVRRVCRDLNVLQNRQWFEREDGVITYVLDHSGYDMCQVLGVYLDREEGHARVDQSNYVDVEVGRDTTRWTFTNQNAYAFDKVLVRFSVRPTMDSESYPMLVFSQYSELIKLAFLSDIMPYVHKRNKRVPSRDYDAEYMREMRGEKFRTSKGWGPENVGMFTAGEASYRG